MADSSPQVKDKDKPLPSKCATPGCNCKGPLSLHSMCHVGAPTWAVLVGDVVLLRCSICQSVVTGLRVTGLVPHMEAMACLAFIESTCLETTNLVPRQD